MTRSRLPMVRGDRLHWLDDAGNQIAPVVVGSDAWYTWLANLQIRSFSFQNARGAFTARRERKRHGWYWYAYRKYGKSPKIICLSSSPLLSGASRRK